MRAGGRGKAKPIIISRGTYLPTYGWEIIRSKQTSRPCMCLLESMGKGRDGWGRWAKRHVSERSKYRNS